MALHDAQEGTDKVKQELDQEKTATAQLGLQLKEVRDEWRYERLVCLRRVGPAHLLERC